MFVQAPDWLGNVAILGAILLLRWCFTLLNGYLRQTDRQNSQRPSGTLAIDTLYRLHFKITTLESVGRSSISHILGSSGSWLVFRSTHTTWRTLLALMCSVQHTSNGTHRLALRCYCVCLREALLMFVGTGQRKQIGVVQSEVS